MYTRERWFSMNKSYVLTMNILGKFKKVQRSLSIESPHAKIKGVDLLNIFLSQHSRPLPWPGIFY